MNWRLIFILSLIGPTLSLAGILGFIGFKYEPYIVFALFILFSILFSINKTGRYFLHAFVTAILLGLSMSIIRLVFLASYISKNPEAIDKVETFLQQLHFIRSPFIILGSLIFISSLLAGIISWLISKLLRSIR